MSTSQVIFNWGLGAMSAAFGFLARYMWHSIKDLQSADKDMMEKVSAVEVLVAGQYVKQSDLCRISDAVFKKLDRIEDKLDMKVDK